MIRLPLRCARCFRTHDKAALCLSTFHDNEDIVKEIEKGKCWNASSSIYRKKQLAIQY